MTLPHIQTRYFLSLLILAGAFAAVAAPLSAQTGNEHPLAPTDALHQRATVWERTLAEVAKKERAALFVDVDLKTTPPNIRYTRPYGVPAMQALACALRRQWKQVEGIQTFARAQDDDTDEDAQDLDRAITWLQSLPAPLLQALVEGKLNFTQLDGATQNLMLRLAAWEPDMGMALLDKGDRVGVRLVISPLLAYTDPRTGKRVTQSIPFYPAPPELPAHTEHRVVPLDRPEAGQLDFGDGSVLTLTDIVAKAAQAFSTRYYIDSRIAESRYFVCGELTQEAFEKALEQMTVIPPVKRRPARTSHDSDYAQLKARLQGYPSQIDVTRLRDRLQLDSSAAIQQLEQQYGAAEELSTADFLQGKTVSAGDLSQGKPGLTNFLTQLGIAPDTLLTLSYQFVLAIQSDGLHPLSHGSATFNGQSMPEFSPNETQIGLN